MLRKDEAAKRYFLTELAARGLSLPSFDSMDKREDIVEHTLQAVAHEIRNPLGGISAGIHYMGRHDGFPEELLENVGVIEGEIQRLDGIIKNLLEVARPVEMQLVEPHAPRGLYSNPSDRSASNLAAHFSSRRGY